MKTTLKSVLVAILAAIVVNSVKADLVYDMANELAIYSGPSPCPQVVVPLNWNIFKAQGDWYLQASDNNLNQAGCIGCNTVQISYWQPLDDLPQFILNHCCMTSCSAPDIKRTLGVKCGNVIGSGFMTPDRAHPNCGITRYSNQGMDHQMFWLGFDTNSFMILYSCVSYVENPGDAAQAANILRIYTREVNPSALTMSQISQVLGRYSWLNIDNYSQIQQGTGNGITCIYV